MGKKLIIAPSARRDLHDIVVEIARDAPQRAIAFGDALLDRAEQAAEFRTQVARFLNSTISIFAS